MINREVKTSSEKQAWVSSLLPKTALIKYITITSPHAASPLYCNSSCCPPAPQPLQFVPSLLQSSLQSSVEAAYKAIHVIERKGMLYGPLDPTDPPSIKYKEQHRTARRDKSKLYFNMIMSPGAFISTPASELHRSRRAILSPFFSKQSIRRIEPILQDALLNIVDRLGKYVKSGVPMRTNLLFTAAASGVITEYAFKRS
jgi:cytochrome P450